MEIYLCKSRCLAGTSYKEVNRKARRFFREEIESKTKRKPYIRNSYFGKKKIFYDNFWVHLSQKREVDRVRRLKVFPAAVELIIKSKIKPDSFNNLLCVGEMFYRFIVRSGDGLYFIVQLKMTRKKGIQFMSCFPKK